MTMHGVLIVDDDKDVLNMLQLLLKSFNPLVACNTDDAVELYNRYKPPVVLLDMMMESENSGELFLNMIGNNDHDSVIYVMSARNLSSDEQANMIYKGATGVIKKSTPVQLIEAQVWRGINLTKKWKKHCTSSQKSTKNNRVLNFLSSCYAAL